MCTVKGWKRSRIRNINITRQINLKTFFQSNFSFWILLFLKCAQITHLQRICDLLITIQRPNELRMVAAFLQLHNNVEKAVDIPLHAFVQSFVVFSQNPPVTLIKVINRQSTTTTKERSIAETN